MPTGMFAPSHPLLADIARFQERSRRPVTRADMDRAARSLTGRHEPPPAPAQPPPRQPFVPTGSATTWRPTLGERLARAWANVAGFASGPEVRARMEREAGYLPVIGDAMTAGDAGSAFGRGDAMEGIGLTALAAIGAAPGVGDVAASALRNVGRRLRRTKGLPMDDASRAARATEQGYLPETFWHAGHGAGPNRMNEGTFFSRDPEYAAGRAEVIGAPLREFRLAPERTLSYRRPVTLGQYADTIRALDDLGEHGAASSLVTGVPIEGNYGKDELLALASRHADVELMPGSLFYQALERNVSSGRPANVLRRAGFDAIDTGRDVQMLGDQGIRLTSARFDPALRKESNINYGFVPLVGAAGVGLYASQRPEASSGGNSPYF